MRIRKAIYLLIPLLLILACSRSEENKKQTDCTFDWKDKHDLYIDRLGEFMVWELENDISDLAIQLKPLLGAYDQLISTCGAEVKILIYPDSISQNIKDIISVKSGEKISCEYCHEKIDEIIGVIKDKMDKYAEINSLRRVKPD
jgi:hypothetical protein